MRQEIDDVFWMTTPSKAGTLEVFDEQASDYLAIPVIGATMDRWSEVNARIQDLAIRMGRRGIGPVGPPFYRYRVVGGRSGRWEVEVCFSTGDGADAPDGVVRGRVEAGRYAKWLHHGHPDRLESVHRQVVEELAGMSLEPDTEPDHGATRWVGLFEAFMTDPAAEPDPDRWDTLVACRVRNA